MGNSMQANAEPLTPISSVEAARVLLGIATDRKQMVTPRKMQKLVYLAHEDHLRTRRMPLVVQDLIEAQDDGPVFVNLDAIFGNVDAGFVKRESLEKSSVEFDGDKTMRGKIEEFLTEIYERHENKTGRELSKATHKWWSPWWVARKSVMPRIGILNWIQKPVPVLYPLIDDQMILRLSPAPSS